ncbi:hypothetical protein Q3G72_018057 [Acer saccharum]|nr:hypothetical protein Q3G72_018057 [Acer saccharum]
MEVNESGMQQRFTWNRRENRWIGFWSAPKEQCDYYNHCGTNSNCNPYHSDVFECTCLPGYEPKYPQEWYLRDGSGGCKRKPGMSMCQNREGFIKVPCLKDLYVRVNAAELALSAKNGSLGKKEIVAIVVSSSVAILLLVALVYWFYRRKIKVKSRSGDFTYNTFTSSTFLDVSLSGNDQDGNRRNTDLPLFDFSTIAAATNNFSIENKLGEGGFGSVYKGVLPNGREIAIKRLSKYSGQGIGEFKNEVSLIAKLQHRNLVSIVGCCIEAEEKMLVYEYVPNKSLDFFIFNETKRTLIFGGEQTEGNTNRVVGTYGYMSPEYAMEGLFSIKSDVYSFGVLLVEIITGIKNSGFHLEDCDSSNLVGHVWDLWREGKAMEIVDKSISNKNGDATWTGTTEGGSSINDVTISTFHGR